MTQAQVQKSEEITLREPVFLWLPPIRLRITGKVFLMLLAVSGYCVLSASIGRGGMPVYFALTVSIVIPIAALLLITPRAQRQQIQRLAAVRARINDDAEISEIVKNERLKQAAQLASNCELLPPIFRGALEDLFLDLAESRSLLSLKGQGFWSWEKLESERIRRGLPRPIVAASSQLESELRTIAKPAELLEPEFIVSSSPRGVSGSYFVTGLWVMNALMSYAARSWYFAAFWTVGALAMLLEHPGLRKRFPALRAESRAPVAGLGSIEDYAGKRWTVDQATMLIWASGAGKPLYVYVVGPAGWLTLTFTGSSDPDFVNLWQRWMHPHPRPELS